MNLRKKKKGFTLIELMAVIAIIAILAAVLVPTVTGYIERSKKTAVITQTRNVVSAVETHNATAGSGDQIKLDDTLSTITNKIGTDLLSDVTKLDSELKYATMKDINTDTNAIKNIKIDSNGKITSYISSNTVKYKNDKNVEVTVQIGFGPQS